MQTTSQILMTITFISTVSNKLQSKLKMNQFKKKRRKNAVFLFFSKPWQTLNSHA